MTAQDLQRVANELRVDVLSMARGDFGVHLAGPLSSSEIYAVLYLGGVVRVSPSDPWDEGRDRVILSCGHYVPILYATLARAGYFDKKRLATFGKIGGLPVHPEYDLANANVPGIEASTGPLAQGMSVAVGRAKALKLKRSKAQVFCVVSDGEMQEGQAWEAIALAVREKLDNLIFIVDQNNVQIEHYVHELSGVMSLTSKLEAFGCYVLEVDGHDTDKLGEVMLRAKNRSRGEVVVVVAKTVGGKGVSWMENDPKWHDGMISDEQFEMAKKELK